MVNICLLDMCAYHDRHLHDRCDDMCCGAYWPCEVIMTLQADMLQRRLPSSLPVQAAHRCLSATASAQCVSALVLLSCAPGRRPVWRAMRGQVLGES